MVAAYVPLHLWRRMTDRRDGVAPLSRLPIVVGSPGGVDFGDMKEPHVLDPAHMDAIDMEAAGISQPRALPPMQAEVGGELPNRQTWWTEPQSRAGPEPVQKGKWDKQPTQSSAVLIATVGIAIPPAVIRRAVS